MKRYRAITALIVIILLIIACSKKEEKPVGNIPAMTEKTPEVEEVVNEPKTETKVIQEKEPVEEKVEIDEGPAVFTIQILSLPDLSRVELQKELMQKKGISTLITTFDLRGTTYYRLRLAGKYTKAGAKKLGEEIKRNFWSITDYWLVEA